MKSDFPMRRRISELEKIHGERPNPDDAEALERAFQIINHLGWLKGCGCEAAAEVGKLFVGFDFGEKDEKKLAAFRRKLVALDRKAAAWLRDNPDPQPINSVHSQPAETISERPPLRLIQ